MIAFAEIYQAAVDRTGSATKLKKLLPVPRTTTQLKQLTDSDCLANMTRRIFQAGLSRQLIDNKWPAFEAAFYQFGIHQVSAMSDEDLERLMEGPQLVRHWGKIQSVRYNAQVICRLNEQLGSFVNYLAEWPADNIVSLWTVLKKQFKHLGGNSAAYFLRRIKKDTFLLTDDVIKAMHYWHAIDMIPTTQKNERQVQHCMNQWQAESERPYCQLSMILALSVD